MSKSTLIKLLLLTSLVLLPRLWPFPPGFVTVDEVITARWLTQMAGGVFSQNWVATANDTYPAVTLMWLEVAQVPLLHLTTSDSYDHLLSDDEVTAFASLPRRRFALGLINGLILLAAFALIRRLFNETTALIATLLMALDPFMLTQSQVVRTEGLNYGLMLLSALSIITYAPTRHRRWLILSAILGGLATLTRFISIYLWPFATLVLLLHVRWERGEAKFQSSKIEAGSNSLFRSFAPFAFFVFSRSLAWLTIATFTFIILWPALWVAPLQTMGALYDHLSRTAQGVDIVWHEGQFFYQGQLWHSNPGIGFYGWALAYRSTPFMWLGLTFLLIYLLQRRFRLELLFATRLIALVAYIAFYLIAMSLGESKLDRYLLPTFPAFAILAAVGYERVFVYLTKPHRFQKPVRFALTLALLLTTHLAFTAYYFPYYFTYWNPLLGGATSAVKILPVGTGEGMDKMVSYLNTLPNATRLKVASNHQTCRFAFVGTCLSADNFLASDYFITIIAGIQRQQPLADISSLLPEAELVNQYRHNGLDYAWLYRLPPGLHAVGEWLGEHGRLSGFRLQPTPLTSPLSQGGERGVKLSQGGERGVKLSQGGEHAIAEVGAGDSLNLTLFWQNGAHGWQLNDSEFFVTIRDANQRHFMTTIFSSPLIQGGQRGVEPEQILPFTTTLTLPQTMPLGEYTLNFGLRLINTRQVTWRFDLNNVPHTFMVTRGTSDLQGFQNLVGLKSNYVQSFGYEGLQLLGYQFKPDSQWLLYWQTDHPPAQNYRLNVTWRDEMGYFVISWENTLAPPYHPLTAWQPREVVGLDLPLLTPAHLPNGTYQPMLTLLAATDPLTLASLTLPAQSITWLTPTVSHQHTLDNVSFNQQLDLFGYDLHAQLGDKEGQLTVTLHWLNRYPLLPREIKLQLLDETGQIIATNQQPLPVSETWPMAPNVSQHILKLTAPPAQLIIQTRPVGQTAWDTVYHANQPQNDSLTIDQLLNKINPN